ncbi:MAG: zinc ribbon domain-containing protein [Thermoplasmata archaeon]|nr:MAG: zinc ribbon domain-containing protein [Thermoplasmata archaeon]
MRTGYVAIGIILLLIGILMVLFFWPLIDYETKDTFHIEDVKAKETIRYVGEITNITEIGDVQVLEMDEDVLQVYTKEKDFDLQENVLITIEFGDNTTNWEENIYQVQRIPTFEGSLGAFLFIFGSVVMIVGFATRKRKLLESVKFTLQPAAQGKKIEQVTCPKCGNVFGVQGLTRPAKITCPECGLEGTIS